MKVCRIVDKFPTGKDILGDLGPNYYNYAKLSVQKGVEEFIICRREKGQPREETIEGINVLRVSPQDVKHPRRDYLYGEFGKKALMEVKRIKPDFVHGHTSFHFYLARNKKVLQKKGIKLITHLHGPVDLSKYTEKLPFGFDFKAALKERLLAQTYFFENKYVTKKADLIIACDNYTKNSALRYYNKKVEVVYNGVDYDKFKRVKSDLKERYGVDYLLMDIARPVPWKGVQYLLRALKELNEEYNSYCLLIGMKRGDHDVGYRWLNFMAKKLELRNVEFLPRIPYYDLPKYYSACDCFVTPAYPDPSPKTVYEAQACSTPVAATNGGGIPEIFGEESGLLFEPRTVTDIVDKISIILDNPDKFRGGRKIIKNRATWKKCVDRMFEVYKKCLN